MKRIRPSIYKELQPIIDEPPKVKVFPLTKGDKKKAKVMEELINYMFENDVNGFHKKWLHVLKRASEKFVRDEIKVYWDKK